MPASWIFASRNNAAHCALAEDGEGASTRKVVPMQATTTLESRETVSLIGSDKVEGTRFTAPTDKIGEIERVMIDKISGKVAYAVLSFGGFLGIGEDYYPVPWATLKYDTKLGGYVTGLTKDKFEKAPKYSDSTGWNWTRENDQRVYGYYGAVPYWPA